MPDYICDTCGCHSDFHFATPQGVAGCSGEDEKGCDCKGFAGD